jgi:hypothetical protein
MVSFVRFRAPLTGMETSQVCIIVPFERVRDHNNGCPISLGDVATFEGGEQMQRVLLV